MYEEVFVIKIEILSSFSFPESAKPSSQVHRCRNIRLGCHGCFFLRMFSFFPILLALFPYLLNYLTELFKLEEANTHRCILAGVNSIPTNDRGNTAF